ncbi:MAG TPA: hypothetical protein VFH56_00315 [Acidimicrobiales bacterium]|nr:hypothetical protein [Acidimicrobiales bacterium]
MALEPEETITCIDCGGVAHLLSTWPPDDPPQPGDVMVYRCADCLDRWDLVLPEDDELGDSPGG